MAFCNGEKVRSSRSASSTAFETAFQIEFSTYGALRVFAANSRVALPGCESSGRCGWPARAGARPYLRRQGGDVDAMLESSGAQNGPTAPGHIHVAGGRGGRRLIACFFRRRCSCRRSAGGAWWTSALGWAAAPCSCTICRRWPPATSTSRWAAAFCAHSCAVRVVLLIELHFRTPPVIL